MRLKITNKSIIATEKIFVMIPKTKFTFFLVKNSSDKLFFRSLQRLCYEFPDKLTLALALANKKIVWTIKSLQLFTIATGSDEVE